jgi:hypothetical protein
MINEKERKHFFFEKKKQKTFTSVAGQVPYQRTVAGSKSLLVLFFRKELLSFRYPNLNRPR